MNERGQYGQPQGPQSGSTPRAYLAPWTEGQRQALQRALAVSAIGSVAGAVLWKDHRIWGFILGGMAGHAVGNLTFTPPTEYPWQRNRTW